MRTTYPTKEVAHLWAHQTQEHASGPGHTIRFYGDALYSYQEQIGQLVERKGKRAALLHSGSWSITTTTHQQNAAMAVQHLPSFTVPEISSTGPLSKEQHKLNINHYRAEIAKASATAVRARVWSEHHADRATRLTVAARGYCRFFGLRYKIADPEDKAGVLRFIAQQKKAQAKSLARKRAERATYLRKHLPGWRNGTMDLNSSDTFLRVRGENVESSRGAVVPASDARRLLPLIQAIKNGERAPFVANGEKVRVGYYSLDAITSSGTVRIGCHTIPWAEIEYIAGAIDA